MGVSMATLLVCIGGGVLVRLLGMGIYSDTLLYESIGQWISIYGHGYLDSQKVYYRLYARA